MPPCINKYYILDLRPENSFVRHAVGAGPHGVHGLVAQHPAGARRSSRGTTTSSRACSTAIRVAREIAGSKTVNALGFCVGGTLLACALAVLAARRRRSVASATFLTTMLDFADPGEIGVYVSRELLAAREPALLAGQRVHGSELAGAFASLRANELVWNYVVNNYLKGETPPRVRPALLERRFGEPAGSDVRRTTCSNMYLDNKLREPDALTMARRTDRPVARISMPAYVYRVARRPHRAVAFARTGPRALRRRRRRVRAGRLGPHRGCRQSAGTERQRATTGPTTSSTASADDWLARATQSVTGSWWPHWYRWLNGHAGGHAAPPTCGNTVNTRAARSRRSGRYCRRSGRLSLCTLVTGDAARALLAGDLSRP